MYFLIDFLQLIVTVTCRGLISDFITNLLSEYFQISDFSTLQINVFWGFFLVCTHFLEAFEI